MHERTMLALVDELEKISFSFKDPRLIGAGAGALLGGGLGAVSDPEHRVRNALIGGGLGAVGGAGIGHAVHLDRMADQAFKSNMRQLDGLEGRLKNMDTTFDRLKSESAETDRLFSEVMGHTPPTARPTGLELKKRQFTVLPGGKAQQSPSNPLVKSMEENRAELEQAGVFPGSIRPVSAEEVRRSRLGGLAPLEHQRKMEDALKQHEELVTGPSSPFRQELKEPDILTPKSGPFGQAFRDSQALDQEFSELEWKLQTSDEVAKWMQQQIHGTGKVPSKEEIEAYWESLK